MNHTLLKKNSIDYYLTLIDEVFPLVELMLDSFKNLHLACNVVFYKNFHGCRYYNCKGIDEDDNAFEYHVAKINEYFKKVIKVNDVVRNSDNLIRSKYGRNIEDLFIYNSGLAKYFKRDSWSGDFIFEGIKEFSIQDFVLSIFCLNNVLSL